jgi:Uma2 family endonuclease
MPTVAKRRPAIRSGPRTFDDFLAMVHEDEKADLLNGVIYMASPESLDDNDLGGWLYAILRDYLEEFDLGKVYYTRVAYRLNEKNGPEPDVGFVSKARVGRLQHGFVAGAPDVAVEIVSPDSVERDYVLKRDLYERAGVKEYWIIDPDEQRTTFLRRVRGKFREIAVKDSVFRSQILPGFWLDVRWLWTKPLPRVRKVMDQLLADR